MNISLLLEMAAEAAPDRVAVGRRSDGLAYAGLLESARRMAALLEKSSAPRLVLVAPNSNAIPALLFGSALAGIPLVPMNYRLADAQLRSLLARTAPALAVVDPSVPNRVGRIDGIKFHTLDDVRARIDDRPAGVSGAAPGDEVATLLYTSGTTGEPKAAVLRHRHLAAYVVATVEFMTAAAGEATLVSVPPYHVAGIVTILTSVYAGRRLVYLPVFDAENWVGVARDEKVTHAMVVPTMLSRILDVLDRRGTGLPDLRHLAYGGGRMPVPTIERALTLLPDVGLVNAYGLTETSSTIAILGANDHRTAFASDDPVVRARLGSVGRPLPSVELEIRDGFGTRLPAGERGEIFVRGDQIAGEYLGRGQTLTADGWFATNDGGWLDSEGYLYVEGRLDDVIVRGAENISPGEIEDVLVAHPAVADACVVGVPDEQWGEAVAAAVVIKPDHTATPDELASWVRTRLRSARTPTRIEFRHQLPYSETGKLLRRVVKAEFASFVENGVQAAGGAKTGTSWA